jgi:hypothetical protein
VNFKLSLPTVGRKHSAKSSLPSVVFVTLGKEPFAECQKKTLGKETLCRVSKIKHSAKSFFADCFLLPSVFCVALDKELFAECQKKTLGKEPNSGSVVFWFIPVQTSQNIVSPSAFDALKIWDHFGQVLLHGTTARLVLQFWIPSSAVF